MKRPEDDGWRICPDVPELLLSIIPRDAKVVELGGGMGSPYLHHLFNQAITIEHAQAWADYLRELGLSFMHLPLVGGWYQESQELNEALKAADCIIVDGPPGQLRAHIRTRLHHFPPDCVVVWDDSQRPHARELLAELTAAGWKLLSEVQDGHRRTTIMKTPRHG